VYNRACAVERFLWPSRQVRVQAIRAAHGSWEGYRHTG